MAVPVGTAVPDGSTDDAEALATRPTETEELRKAEDDAAPEADADVPSDGIAVPVGTTVPDGSTDDAEALATGLIKLEELKVTFL